MEGGLHVIGAGKLPKGTPFLSRPQIFTCYEEDCQGLGPIRAWWQAVLPNSSLWTHHTQYLREQVSREAACILQCSLGGHRLTSPADSPHHSLPVCTRFLTCSSGVLKRSPSIVCESVDSRVPTRCLLNFTQRFTCLRVHAFDSAFKVFQLAKQSCSTSLGALPRSSRCSAARTTAAGVPHCLLPPAQSSAACRG